jgi:hypothetical protein
VTSHRDSGSAALLLIVLVAVASSMAVHVSSLGRAAVQEATVQSIADAVVLAGVLGSRERAEDVARANSATLIVYEESQPDALGGRVVHVVISVEHHRGSAWASDAS